MKDQNPHAMPASETPHTAIDETPSASAETRRNFLRTAAGVAAGLGLAEFLPGPHAETQASSFNPPELVHQNGKLQAVIQMVEAQRSYPNGPAKGDGRYLRMFQGWYPARAEKPTKPVINPDAAGPGPTLRGKVGGKVEITFINKVDESKFPYSIDTAENMQYGCDASTPIELYPSADTWPNCFHGSSTANLHFHGTHVTPDGLGDNVLVQVVPDRNTKESDWTAAFNEVFNAPNCPISWSQMPKKGYQDKQLGASHETPGGLVGAHDKAAAEQAKRDKRKPPESLWKADQKMVHAGLWPQYVIGAYPNCFNIPEYKPGGPWKMGQAPGTHWYHAHKHGSTALHILNGLAGAFIIEGDYDARIQDFYAKKVGRPVVENIFVFQNIDSSQNLKRQNPGANKTGSSQQLINGKNNPIIPMQPGEVQWWRIVNATVGGFHGTIAQAVFDQLTQAGFQLMQTAQDGVQFRWENYQSQPFLTKKVPGGLNLASGNRADILVKAPSSPARVTVNGQPGPGGPVLTVAVAGDKLNMPFITDESDFPKFPDFLTDLKAPSPTPTRVLKFGWEKGRGFPGRNPGAPAIGMPPHFTIDGKQFEQDGPKIDQCITLNALEDWLIENYTTVPHPFHIHVNPFQVITITSTDGTPPYSPGSNNIWQDTIDLPPGKSNADDSITPGSVLIRHQFVDFTGTYVLHCHILAHEDRGMMQLVRVNPPGGTCQANIPEHH
jgi:FtsP/CotA-like multicopper oxidase with cupredoxin domain